MDVTYETIHDDPKANAVVMQFLALRTLNDEEDSFYDDQVKNNIKYIDVFEY